MTTAGSTGSSKPAFGWSSSVPSDGCLFSFFSFSAFGRSDSAGSDNSLIGDSFFGRFLAPLSCLLGLEGSDSSVAAGDGEVSLRGADLSSCFDDTLDGLVEY